MNVFNSRNILIYSQIKKDNNRETNTCGANKT